MEPVIKVRYKDAFFLALLIPYVCTAAYTRCDKRPLETAAPRAEGSNGFGVTIVGKPLLYRPNTQYKIMIKVKEQSELRRRLLGNNAFSPRI